MTPSQISYIIAALFFVLNIFLERKITVLDMIIALVIITVPYLNAAVFFVNFIIVLDHRGVIYLRGIGHAIVRFLNWRIK